MEFGIHGNHGNNVMSRAAADGSYVRELVSVHILEDQNVWDQQTTLRIVTPMNVRVNIGYAKSRVFVELISR